MDPANPKTIRIGMIAMTDLDDPNPISGMPFYMAGALRAQGIEIVPIHAWKTSAQGRALTKRAQERIIRIHRRRTPMWVKRAMDTILAKSTRRAVLNRASKISGCVQTNLDTMLSQGQQLDALFGCCISTALYGLETNIPIIYFSDATSPVLEMTYPVRARRGLPYRRALHDVEQASLEITSKAIFAAPATQKSAIEDFGLDPKRTSVVAMGAHVYPPDPDLIHSPASSPTREDCKLLIVAADPIRKRVNLATHAAEILRDRGINATLHVVGKGTKKSKNSPAVDSIGPLKLSDTADRARHMDLLADCHLQMLPSLGEAYGIAPCESAHFARPSIVSRVGGLPFVVIDNETGVVLDVNADAIDWADAIETLIDDPDSYRLRSSKALDRAQTELNWTTWGQRVHSIILEQIERTS